MASTINAKTTGVGGIDASGDASGVLQLQTGGTAAVTVDASQNVGIGTSSPAARLQVQSGTSTILAGADSGATTLTNATQKVMRFGVPHYTNAEEPVCGLFVSNESTVSTVLIGGGTGQFNAATSLQFYTAANTTTTSGTERMRINSSGDVQLSTAGTSLLNSSGRKILNQTGSVLQVVNATYATQTATNSTTMVDTGLTATITPSSTSSKILVIVQQGGCGKDTNDTTLQLQLLRGATVLFRFEASAGWTAAAGRNFIGTCGTTFLDSPSTTSPVAYKTQQASFNGGANTFTQFNVGAGNATSTITLLEIAG
jgi:hypothetical protein